LGRILLDDAPHLLFSALLIIAISAGQVCLPLHEKQGRDMARIISRAELEALFTGELADKHKPILSPAGLANLLGLKLKTIYTWIAAGRLDGCFRKRGKHNLIWRDKALDRIFNGSDWND
jgi:hypothetical protein